MTLFRNSAELKYSKMIVSAKATNVGSLQIVRAHSLMKEHFLTRLVYKIDRHFTLEVPLKKEIIK